MIDIVFSEPAAALFRTAAFRLEWVKETMQRDGVDIEIREIKDYKKILFLDFKLDIGDLSFDVNSEYRLRRISEDFYWDYIRSGIAEEVDLLEDGMRSLECFEEMLDYAKNGESFRLWYSNEGKEMCGFLHACSILQKYSSEVYAVKIPDIAIHTGKIKELSNWSHVDVYDFGYLIDNQRLISKEELDFYSDKWDKLVKENAPLRAVISNSIQSVPEDFYDGIILNAFKENKMIESELSYIIRRLEIGIGDSFVSRRMWEMEKRGLIRLIEDNARANKRIWEKV